MPASAIDAPITFRKPRRETESTHSDAPLGNSRCSASWNAGLPASSSRLRQYSGPVLAARSISRRNDSKSGLPFLLVQTSARLRLSASCWLWSSISIFCDFSFPLAMTRVATGDIGNAALSVAGHHHSCADFVFADQVSAQRILIGKVFLINRHGAAFRRRLIAHVENLVTRPQVFPGIAMASQAPLHLQRFLLVHQRHLIDRTMTRVATHPLVDMNTVIEEDEVGKLIHARPLQRFPAAVAGSHRLKQRGVGPDLRVAIHAGLGGRDAGKTRRFHRRMAVAAVDAEPADVVLMAERYWLRLSHSGISEVRRALYFHRHPGQSGNHEYRAVNGG